MFRIPVEEFPIRKYDDYDVINSWKWFMSFMSEHDWKARKINIEKKIIMEFRDTPPFSKPLTEGTLIAIRDNDVIGWYLYLLDMLINEPHKYEFYQGARVVPIFKRFGINLDLLKSIDGVEKRIRALLKKRRAEADAILFEILVALLWARNGYKVAFIEEQKDGPTPDLLVKKGEDIFCIECKRQSKTADYTYQETAKRQKMISQIGALLIKHNVLLEIEFHVELNSLPDSFLKDLLESKLSSPTAGKVISNKQVDIDLSFIDLSAIRNHLRKYYVKNHSPMLNNLIANKPIDNKGFTCAILANFFRVGEGDVNNLYIADISKAFGVFWSCDAPEALWAKARDIKSQIQSALKQFDSENTAVIHIGLETFDGPAVERQRFEKIKETVAKINPDETKLRWLFCNFFQAYSPPDQDWIFDETVSTITPYIFPIPPISEKLMVVDGNDTFEDLSHWERPLP